MDINNKIKEQRTVQAINNDLMGSQGKIALICQAFGEPIIYDNDISDAESLLNINDGFYDFDESGIKTFSENHSSYQIGLWYDGLKSGNGLEIKFLNHENEIKLYYKGYLKYHEESNNLLIYNPDGDWEKIVESIYFVAKKKIIEMNKKTLQENEVFKEKQKEKLIEEINKNWGKEFFN
jgi:hypothetical protein